MWTFTIWQKPSTGVNLNWRSVACNVNAAWFPCHMQHFFYPGSNPCMLLVMPWIRTINDIKLNGKGFRSVGHRTCKPDGNTRWAGSGQGLHKQRDSKQVEQNEKVLMAQSIQRGIGKSRMDFTVDDRSTYSNSSIAVRFARMHLGRIWKKGWG